MAAEGQAGDRLLLEPSLWSEPHPSGAGSPVALLGGRQSDRLSSLDGRDLRVRGSPGRPSKTRKPA